MKILVVFLVVVALGFGAWKVVEYWDTVKEREAKLQQTTTEFDPKTLPGVPPQLEPMLQEAYKKGAPGLKDWLQKSKRSPQIKDPRLAWIELDYVVLITHDNAQEARRVFAEVKRRTPAQSPVYPRIQSLQKTYED